MKKIISNKQKDFLDTVLLILPAVPLFVVSIELTNRVRYPLAEIRGGQVVAVLERLHPSWAFLGIGVSMLLYFLYYGFMILAQESYLEVDADRLILLPMVRRTPRAILYAFRRREERSPECLRYEQVKEVNRAGPFTMRLELTDGSYRTCYGRKYFYDCVYVRLIGRELGLELEE